LVDVYYKKSPEKEKRYVGLYFLQDHKGSNSFHEGV
jgi:hypothetical protein